MKYSTVENPIWVNAEHTMFNCMVNFEGIGIVEFSCTNADPEPHSQEIWARAMDGDFGPIAEYAPWTPPEGEQVTATPPSGQIPGAVL